MHKTAYLLLSLVKNLSYTVKVYSKFFTSAKKQICNFLSYKPVAIKELKKCKVYFCFAEIHKPLWVYGGYPTKTFGHGR